MADVDDDKETKPLAPRVLRALEQARDAAREDRQRKEGRYLALIPVILALVILGFMMPRAAEPDAIPLPIVSPRALASTAAEDDALAARAESQRLPGDILSVGTAIRGLHDAELKLSEAKDGKDAAAAIDESAVLDARRQLDLSLARLTARPNIREDLLALRAVQVRHLLNAIAKWEATGESSDDLRQLGGVFLRRAADGGWLKDRKLLMSDAERRVAFKTVWNTLTSSDGRKGFALTLDEQRALYAFYIQNPHPPDSHRDLLAAERREARTKEACTRADFNLRRETEQWRIDKIKRLAFIDPDYPAGYAIGVAQYRAGRYDLATDAFNVYLAKTPDGPYALRARNHLKASLIANGAL